MSDVLPTASRISALLSTDARAVLLHDALADAEASSYTLRVALVETSVELLAARRERDAALDALADAAHAASASGAISSALAAAGVAPGARHAGCVVFDGSSRVVFATLGAVAGCLITIASNAISIQDALAAACIAVFASSRGLFGSAGGASLALRATATALSLPTTAKLLLKSDLPDAESDNGVLLLVLAAFWLLSYVSAFAATLHLRTRLMSARARFSVVTSQCEGGVASADACAPPLALLELSALDSRVARSIWAAVLAAALGVCIASGALAGLPPLAAIPQAAHGAGRAVVALLCKNILDRKAHNDTEALLQSLRTLLEAFTHDAGPLFLSIFVPSIATGL